MTLRTLVLAVALCAVGVLGCAALGIDTTGVGVGIGVAIALALNDRR